MEKTDAELLKVLNTSGFPFQIGVRREIERTKPTHGWEVDAEEYHWLHPASKAAGFIDLVSSHDQYIFTLLIECKRVKENGEWLFLTPREYAGDRKRLSALLRHQEGAGERGFLQLVRLRFRSRFTGSGLLRVPQARGKESDAGVDRGRSAVGRGRSGA